jgi:L-alanine-DL-glutamate epimerase-like enolase superfamily enzyme
MTKIIDVELVLLTTEFDHMGATGRRSYGTVRISTDDGLVGLGESYCMINMPLACREAVEVIKPLLLGEDAESYEALVQKAHDVCEYFDHQGMVYCVIGAIDWALHDLAAQRAGLPLHKFLNPDSSDSIEIYASTGFATWSVDSVIEDLENCRRNGFRSAKMRPTTDFADVTSAIQRVHDVFARLPDGMRLGVDPGQQIFHLPERWPLEAAKRLVREVADHPIRFLEDTLQIQDLAGYVELRKMGEIPIAGGEMFHDVESFRRYFEAGAFDVAQPDACVIPGPKRCLEVGALAVEHGVELIMHGWAGPVAQMQNIHIGLACEASDTVENAIHMRPLSEDLIPDYIVPNEGRIEAPADPGMGVRITDEVVARYPYQGVSMIIA